MTAPCLCGDPACARCFPWGQERVTCGLCGWKGQRHECGTDEVSEGVISTCPVCCADVVEDEER